MLIALVLVGLGMVASPPAGSAEETESAASVRTDPASDRLRFVIIGLVGLGGVLLVGTARFWWVTRPALVGAPPARSTRSAADDPSSPPRIPASVVLAGPLTTPAIDAIDAPQPTVAPVAEPAVSPSVVSATAVSPLAVPTPPVSPLPVSPMPAPSPIVDADLDHIPPPSGAPVLLPPPPGAVESPLVGDDSVWLIGDETPAPAPTPEPAVFCAPEAVVAEPAIPQAPLPSTGLIAALAALPDHDGSRVRFDDPPVERVAPRGRTRRPEPAPQLEPDPASVPEPELVVEPEPEVEHEVELEPEIVLDGAPDFDRMARDPVEESAVLVDVPPVGVFYDQDLDPGDPPGRGS